MPFWDAGSCVRLPVCDSGLSPGGRACVVLGGSSRRGAPVEVKSVPLVHAPGVLAVAVSGGPLSLCVGEFRVLVRVSLGLRVTRPGSLPRSHWGIRPLGAQLGWTELCWASGL